MEESSRSRFDILINGQMAEANADIIKWSGGSGVAVYMDYMAMMDGDRMEGKRDLLISLKPKLNNNTKWWTGSTDNNPDNNLEGLNPVPDNNLF